MQIAAATGVPPSRVSRIAGGKTHVEELAVFEGIADGLRMPDHVRGLLGLAPQTPPRVRRTGSATRPDTTPRVAEAADAELVYNHAIGPTLAAVRSLGRADVKRRTLIGKAPFIMAAFGAPSRDWLVSTLDTDKKPPRAGMAQVEAIRSMFSTFQELDVLHGSGSGRIALAQYLTTTVLPAVDRAHNEDVQLALYGVAAELTYLAGWMSFDAGEHGLAQRYLIQSLRLSEASQDRMLGSHVLAGMSTQLGFPREGLRLAQAGRHALRGMRAPAAMTDLYTLEARALAALHEDTDCALSIHRAEQMFERINPGDEPEWARFIDEAYVFGEFANSFRDIRDAPNAAKFARLSADASRRQNRGRRGALSKATLATSHFQQREFEAAAQAADQALDLALTVQSSRCTEALASLHTHLEAHRRNPQVGQFVERYEAVYAVR